VSSPVYPPKGRGQRFIEWRERIERRRAAAREANIEARTKARLAKIDRLQADLYDDRLSDDEFIAAAKRFDVAIRSSHRKVMRSVARRRVASPRPVRLIIPRRPRRESHRTRPGLRRGGATSTTASADPGGDGPASDGDPWPGGFSFRDFDELVSRERPGQVRLALFHALPERWQREAWAYERYALDLQWAVQS